MTYLIFDLILVAVLLFFFWRGYKRGLILTLCSLLAVFVAYREEIVDMIVEFFAGVRDLAHRTTPTPVPPARRLILLIIVGLNNMIKCLLMTFCLPVIPDCNIT